LDWCGLRCATGLSFGPCFLSNIYQWLPHMISNTCLLFADSTRIYSILGVKTMYVNCSRILLNWKSGLKCDKCPLMFPSAKSLYTWVELNPTMCIAWLAVKEERVLGVLFDNKLKFHNCSSTAINKARRLLRLISKSFINLCPRTFSHLYKVIVIPCLEYGNIIWDPIIRLMKI